MYRVTKPITTNDDLRTWAGQARIGLKWLTTGRGPLGIGINQGGLFTRILPGSQTPDIQFHFATLSAELAGAKPHPWPGCTFSVASCARNRAAASKSDRRRWSAVFEETTRDSVAEIVPGDDQPVAPGAHDEMLSERQCPGWLEGYLLIRTAWHLSCYEAFIHIIDAMFDQHAKWLKVTREIPWRRSISSLTYVLTSHVWRQDHNGFSHQDPGFVDHVVNKKADVIRVYFPPDANTCLSVTDHCLRSVDYVNVVVIGKQPAPQWLTMDRRSSTARRASASGSSRATTPAAFRTSSWPARGRADGGDARGGEPLARAFAQPQGARHQRGRPR